MDTNFQNLAELHLHLGAAITPHFLWELAHEQGIRLPEKNYWNFIKLLQVKKTTSEKYLRKLNGSQKYLSPFELSQNIQSSPLAVEKCVHYAISKNYRESGVSKIEIRFNPFFRNKNGEYDIDKIILSAIVGMQKAVIEYPVKAGLILETDRQFDFKKHKIIFEKAVKYKNLGIVGIDVSGPNPKEGIKIDDFVPLFKFARKSGLKTTFHTGEFTEADEVWEVIQKLNPDRIGHGIKAYKDLELVKELTKRKIILEICPTSNVKTQVVKGWEEIKKALQTFIKYNVPFTINSDGPEFLGTNIKKEFQTLLQKQILTKDQIKKIISFSHKASFI